MMLPQRSIEHHVTGMSEMLAVKPAYEDCAQVKDDCLAAGCCAPSGYNCFKNAKGQGRCMRECMPGGANGTCEGVAPHMKMAVEQPGLSLFCFSVYTENTGGDKVSHELELLQMQHDNAQSLFSCAEWAVYSDVVVPLGGSDMATQVEDVKGDWHILKHKVTRFLPRQSSVRVLQDVRVPQEGIYMENCKFVDWGYYGNLEVFSKEAFETLVANVDTCYDEIDWKLGVHGGKYGAMGEDLFAQKCMDSMKVSRQENFMLSTDGACEADRPEGEKKNRKYIPNCAGVSTPSIHPFKKPAKYAECWAAAKDFQP